MNAENKAWILILTTCGNLDSFICGVTFLSLNPDQTLVFDHYIVHKSIVYNSGRSGKTHQKQSEVIILICSNECNGLISEMFYLYKN